MAIPSDIAGLQVWFQGDLLSGSDGSAVSTWDDSSTNNRDATQGTGGAQPTLQTAELNGLNVVRFDGGDFLVTSAFTQAAQWTMFAVAKRTGGGTPAGIMNTRAGTGHAALRWTAATTMNAYAQVAAGGNNQDDQAALSNVWQIYVARRNTTTVQVWVDGVSDGSTGTGAGPTPTEVLTIGVGFAGPTEQLTGDIAEFFYFNSALSAGDRVSMQDYLTAKWFVPPVVPAGNRMRRWRY